jgi:hypothetical protein
VANYSIANTTNWAAQAATGSTYTAILAVAATSGAFLNAPSITGLKRGRIYDILIGTNGTPADNFVEFSVNRATVGSSPAWVGPISSVSSQTSLDLADGAFSAFAVANTSANSSTVFTLGLSVFYIGVNQRASYRWVAAPGSELVYPAVSSATGSNGLLLSARSAGYTGGATGTILFSEQ